VKKKYFTTLLFIIYFFETFANPFYLPKQNLVFTIIKPNNDRKRIRERSIILSFSFLPLSRQG